MAEPQYIDGSLIGAQNPGVNDRYKKIINYVPVKAPFYNDSYLARFTQGYMEKTDDLTMFFQKRLGFDKIKIYEWDAQEANLVEIVNEDRNFTDSVFLDGIRYMFAVSPDYSKMKIFKQIYTNDDTTCSNNNDMPVNVGYFVNVAQYTYFDTNTSLDVTIRYFPFNKCLYDKFVVADFAKGKSKDSGVDGVIRNALVGLNVQTYFYDTTKNINAMSADYLLVYEGDRATQVNQVSINPSTNGTVTNALLMDQAFAGFANIKPSVKESVFDGVSTTVLIKSLSENIMENSNKHKWKVFPEYGDILSFATSDGIFFLHFSDTKPSQSEFTKEGTTFYNTVNNQNKSPFVITGMALNDSSVLFLNNKNGTLFAGLQGFQKYYYRIQNSYTFGRDYTDLIILSGYVIMAGPNRLTLISPQYLGNGEVTFQGFLPLEEFNGYFNRGSRDVDNGVLRIATRNYNIKKFTLQTFGQSIVPKVDYEKLYYQSDFTVLRPGIEKVYIKVDEGDVKIFFTDGVSTKIHFKDATLGIWYKWLINNVSLINYKNKTWYGDEIYDHTGNKDKGEFYKTLMQYVFGRDAYINTKMFYHIKFVMGYNSIVTKNNTFLKFSADLGGRHYDFAYDDLRRTDYVYNIMKLHNSGNTGTDFKNYPIGITLRGGNGVGFSTPQERIFMDEFAERNNYNTVNDTSSDEVTNFTISKFGIIEYPLSIVGEMFSVEFITYNADALEFGGLMLSYEPLDFDQTRLENVATVHDFSLNGDDNQPLTHDSGTNNDIGV